ncbi:MAG: glyoxalase-like domain protein [Burkholderiales bacterium]|nr:glyoxalase-like domain protein [Burkholderiales bacterium]
MAAMTPELWPARLHHLRRDSPKPEPLARFYGELLGDGVAPLPDGSWLVAGPGRRLVIGKGPAGSVPYFAFELQDKAHLAFRNKLTNSEDFSSPLLREGAFAGTDPDGRRAVFGLPREESSPAGAPGRLQHFVCATERLPQMLEFYRSLGMVESDRVVEGELLSAVFLRSDPEHHSFAAFRAPESRPDHHCYETTGWLDIRDWADRMARLRIPLFWGPGRHGPGNNLFFMIEDPDGHKVEFSAELELMPRAMPPRTWPHEQRTLNLWGSAWMRS